MFTATYWAAPFWSPAYWRNAATGPPPPSGDTGDPALLLLAFLRRSRVGHARRPA